jgi:5-formyltetrahydrofolate cyclo-ligase
MEVEIEKSKLRKIFKERRSTISQTEILKKSQQINQNFISNLLPKIYHDHSEKTFSIYLSCDSEVSTTLISEHFKKNQIKFSYPKIIKKNQPLEFILADKNQRFAPNNFFAKIIEPLSGKKIFPDFIILPLLAFDRDLSRLGMGGGFFDRTIEHLKKQKSEIIVIGLAFDFQRSHDIIPITKTDQKLDFVVTEKTIFSAS